MAQSMLAMSDSSYSSVWVQLTSLSELLATPAGLAGAMALLLFLFTSPTKIVRWGLLTFLVFSTTISRTTSTKLGAALFAPFQAIQIYSRPIIFGLMFALLPAILFAPLLYRRRILTPAAAFFFLFQALFSGRQAFSNGAAYAVAAMFGAAGFFIVFGIGSTRWIQTSQDAYKLIRILVLGVIVFVVCSLIQVQVGFGAAMQGGRFTGIGAGANFSGQTLAFGFLCSAFLLSSGHEKKLFRTIMSVAMGIMGLMIIWTGSRGALLMVVGGLGVMYRARVRWLVGVGIVAALFGIAAYDLLGGETLGITNRVVDTGDSRLEGYKVMFQEFCSSPIVGMTGEEDTHRQTENSFLVVGARAGIVGLIPLLIAEAIIFVQLLKVQRYRRYSREIGGLIDFVSGLFTAVFLASMVEGILVSIFNINPICIYIAAAILQYVLDLVEPSMEQLTPANAYSF